MKDWETANAASTVLCCLESGELAELSADEKLIVLKAAVATVQARIEVAGLKQAMANALLPEKN